MHNHVQKKKRQITEEPGWVLFNTWQTVWEWQLYRPESAADAASVRCHHKAAQFNKTRLVFFTARLNGGDRLLQRLGHVASEPSLEVSIRKPFFAPVLSRCLYVFCCGGRHPTIISSFIITSRMSGLSTHLGQADFLHYTCLMMLFFLFSPPMSKHQLFNKGLRENGGLHPLISPYRSSGRRTPHSLRTLGFNAYVTANLFMKCNKGSHSQIWHICAFLWEDYGRASCGTADTRRKEGEKRVQCFIWASHWIIFKGLILRAGFPVWHD